MNNLKLTEKDFERLKDYARDLDAVQNIGQFVDNVKKRGYAGEKKDDKRSFFRVDQSTDMMDENDFSNQIAVDKIKQKFNDSIRGEKARPGNLGKQKLSPEDPDQFLDVDDVTNSDPISPNTYRKMANDEIFSIGLNILKGWVGSLNYTIKTEDNKIRSVLRYILKNNFKNMVRSLVGKASVFGFCLGEKIWERENVVLEENVAGQSEVVHDGKIINLDTVKYPFIDEIDDYYKDKKGNLVRVEQVQGNKRISVDSSKLIFFQLDKELGGFFGRSRLKPGYDKWYYAKVTLQQMLNHVQRLGSPNLELRYPQGRSTLSNGETKDNEEIALELAEMLESTGVFLAPSTKHEEGGNKWSINYVDANGRDIDMYLEVEKLMNKQKFFSMGIPNFLNQDANNSQMDALNDIFGIILEDLVGQVEDVINRQVVNQAVEYNFGSQFKSKVYLKIDRSSINQKRIARDILKTAMRVTGSMKKFNPKSFVDIGALAETVGVDSRPFEEVVERSSEDAGFEENNPVDERQRDEDSNGKDRVSDREREERDAEKDDVTESN